MAPLGVQGLDRVVRPALLKNVDALPGVILNQAARRGGLSDDASLVAVRVR